MRIIGTLEGIRPVDGRYEVCLLAPYQRYYVRLTEDALATCLDTCYIGDKVLYEDGAVSLFQLEFSIIQPELDVLAALGQLGGAL